MSGKFGPLTTDTNRMKMARIGVLPDTASHTVTVTVTVAFIKTATNKSGDTLPTPLRPFQDPSHGQKKGGITQATVDVIYAM